MQLAWFLFLYKIFLKTIIAIAIYLVQFFRLRQHNFKSLQVTIRSCFGILLQSSSKLLFRLKWSLVADVNLFIEQQRLKFRHKLNCFSFNKLPQISRLLTSAFVVEWVVLLVLNLLFLFAQQSLNWMQRLVWSAFVILLQSSTASFPLLLCCSNCFSLCWSKIYLWRTTFTSSIVWTCFF